MIDRVQRKRTARNRNSRRKAWLRRRGMYPQLKVTRRYHMVLARQFVPQEPVVAAKRVVPVATKPRRGIVRRVLGLFTWRKGGAR